MAIRITDSICLWSDLLGYGRNFYDTNWNINTEKSRENVDRISQLQPEWIDISNPFNETVFTLNDGLIRNYDLNSNTFAWFLSWIEFAIERFNRINQHDTEKGYPGVRGVMTIGQRVEYIHKDYEGLGEFIQTTAEKKSVYNKKIVVYSPKELQMNTAFSKAYIIEGSGTKMGVTGNKLYIDYNVIKKIIDIANSGISDTFGRIDNDPDPYICYKYKGEFIEFEERAILNISTICDTEHWTSFKIIFDSGREYLNREQSIITKLFVPIEIESALFGPPETE